MNANINSMTPFAGIQQAAALPYVIRGNKLCLLVVTSLGTKRWVLPKGNIDPGLTAWESAEFEAHEEAGVMGRMTVRSIGAYTYRKSDEKDGLYRVRVFPLEVLRELDEYPEAARRKRKWMKTEKAIKAVREPELKALIVRFAERFELNS